MTRFDVPTEIEKTLYDWLSQQAADLEDGETGTVKCFELACERAGLPDAICDWAVNIAMTESALDAGIPLSVIHGKTKLSDHFSQEYIDHMSNKKTVNED